MRVLVKAVLVEHYQKEIKFFIKKKSKQEAKFSLSFNKKKKWAH